MGACVLGCDQPSQRQETPVQVCRVLNIEQCKAKSFTTQRESVYKGVAVLWSILTHTVRICTVFSEKKNSSLWLLYDQHPLSVSFTPETCMVALVLVTSTTLKLDGLRTSNCVLCYYLTFFWHKQLHFFMSAINYWYGFLVGFFNVSLCRGDGKCVCFIGPERKNKSIKSDNEKQF